MRTKLLLILLLVMATGTAVSQTAEEYMNQGVGYYNAGDPIRAIRTFREALRDTTCQDRARLHLFIGIAYLFPTDTIRTTFVLSLAFCEFDSALKIDSTFPDAHYWKGKTYELIADTVGAIEEYRRAVKLNPKYAEAFNQWGVLLYSQGDYKAATDKFRKAIFCEIKNPVYNATFHFNLSLTYLARERYADSAEEMERAKRLNANITGDSRATMSRPMILDSKQLNGATK